MFLMLGIVQSFRFKTVNAVKYFSNVLKLSFFTALDFCLSFGFLNLTMLEGQES